MRILMLTCHPCIQGPFPKILPLLAESLRAQGCAVETEPWARRRDDETFFDKVMGRPGDILRVWRRLRREKFDVMVVHTTTEWPNYSRDIPVLRLCRRLVSRIVLQFHGSSPALVLGDGRTAFKAASRMVLRLSDGVLVLSSEEQRDWRRFFPEGRFAVVTNPFQSRAGAAPVTGALPWKLPSSVPIVLYVGRLLETKGIFDLLEALALMEGRTPFHLLVAGTGAEEQAFKDRIKSLQLQNRVTMAGYLIGDQLWQSYQAADLFVFPSWSEGFPTVITEAMDAGLPMVATHIRGAVDHLQDGVHGRFVPPRDPQSLAKALAELIGNSQLRASMSLANRSKIEDFSPMIVGKRYHDLLRQIVNGTAPDALKR
jgi:glycosyltransferase involved in cell wall biosynthesis